MAVHLIVGGSGGIGAALCARLRARGDTVVAMGRDPERLEALARAHGVDPRVGDATLPGVLEAEVLSAVEEHGQLDGVAVLVGSVLLKPAHRTSDAEWDDTLARNLTVAFRAVRAAAAALRGPASVVLMSSAAAQVGLANHEAIAAAKAGVEGLTRAAAATYASRGLRVNAVAPGLVRTPLTAHLTAGAAEKASLAMHPLGRLGEPDDVAAVIALLLDPANAWISGQVWGVDGGLAHLKPPR